MSGLLSSSQLNTFLDKNHVSSLLFIFIFLGGEKSKQQVVTGSRIQKGQNGPLKKKIKGFFDLKSIVKRIKFFFMGRSRIFFQL